MTSGAAAAGRAAGIALFLGLLAAACGSVAVPTTQVPTDALLERGADLYAANCAACHGDELQGTDTGPSFLDRVYEPGHHADGAFLLAVTRGVPAHHWSFGDMPPVEGLTPDDVAAIVAFVREVQEREGFRD